MEAESSWADLRRSMRWPHVALAACAALTAVAITAKVVAGQLLTRGDPLLQLIDWVAYLSVAVLLTMLAAGGLTRFAVAARRSSATEKRFGRLGPVARYATGACCAIAAGLVLQLLPLPDPDPPIERVVGWLRDAALLAGAGVLMVMFGVFLVHSVRVGMAESAKRRAAQRAERDLLAVSAARHPVPVGTPIASISADHPWRRSFDARSKQVYVVVKSAPSNPYWADQPVMSAAWWALGTAPEDELSHWSRQAAAESTRRFEGWLAHVSIADPDTYRAYVTWAQNEEMIRAQREMVAAQRAAAAAQQQVLAEQQRTTAAARDAAAATRAGTQEQWRQWSTDRVQDR